MGLTERDVLDLLLVGLLGVVTYAKTTDFSKPLTILKRIVGFLASLDVGVYLVFGGIFGIVFLGYMVLYLPGKDGGPISR